MSRQFRALGLMSGLFAGLWATGGVVLGVIAGPSMIGESVISAASAFALLYGLVGAISGAVSALLIARAERGRQVEDIPKPRLTMWGVIAGGAPAALFAAVALAVGGVTGSHLLPLVGMGVLSGGAGGFVLGSAARNGPG